MEHTNFKKAFELKGHQKNTYTKAGSYSIACSQPKRIENIGILELIDDQLSNEADKIINEGNPEFIINFCSKIRELISNYSYLKDSFNDLNESINKVENYKLFHSLLVMNNFKQLTGAQWLIKI